MRTGSRSEIYISKDLAQDPTANEGLFGNGVPLGIVLLEHYIQVIDGLGLESRDPVSQRNGVLHRGDGTGRTRRAELQR